MTPLSASSLSRRYTLLAAICALPLLLLVGTLGAYQFDAQRRSEFEALAAVVSEARLVVERVVQDASDHLVQLQVQAEDQLAGGVPAPGQDLRALLVPSRPARGEARGDELSLDGANPRLRTALGNIFVAADRLQAAAPGELEMALGLFQPMRLTHLVKPNLHWSYYFSASGAFITMFPFAPREELVEGFGYETLAAMIDGYLAYEVYLDATPARNPELVPQWTRPYLDAAGAGWMVSHSVAVKQGPRYVGTLGTDLLLSYLDDTLARLPLKAGRLWIVNPEGDLVADRAGTPVDGDAPRHVRAVLGDALGDPDAALAVILAPGRHDLGGHRILASPIEGTPWTLLFAVSERELAGIVGAGIMPYGIILVGLLTSIFAAHFALRTQFIRPAIALAEHLEAENASVPSNAHVPAVWRPWFTRVSTIVRQNREAMSQLAASEERYRSVVEAQTEFVVRMTPEGRLTLVNDAYCRYHGRSRQELLGPAWCEYDVLPDDERARFLAYLSRLTPDAPVASIELANRLPGHPLRWTAWNDRGIFDEAGRLVEVQSVGRDVTERVIAEHARQETERLRQTVLEAALDGYVGIDREGRIIEFNAAAEAIFGYSRDRVLGQPMVDLIVPPELREQHSRAFERHLATGASTILGRRIQVPALHSDGSQFPIELVIASGVVADQPLFIAYLRDLTDQKKAAAALAERELQFGAIAEGVPLSIIISAIEEPEIFFVNERAQQTLGLEVGQKRERLLAVWKHPEHRLELARQVIAHGVVDAFETTFVRADGREMQALVAARRIEHRGRPAMLAAATDITRQREAEAEIALQREALHQSEKLTALGSLLAGVAHELNNPLSVVVGYSAMLRELSQDPAVVGRAERIHAAAERCSRIVRTFLAMARKRPPVRGAVRLNDVVTAALELAAYGLRSAGVHVNLDLHPDLPPVWGDEDQLHQVVANLVVNAQQALVMVEAPRRLTISTRRDGDMVELAVEDSGPGIPEDARPRIFEPFFTTKATGVGTGVGLSVCSAVVTAHGGSIGVEDAPGAGTRIVVRLPASPELDATAEAPADTPREGSSFSANVLVIDDEPDIAAMVAEMLRRDGHAVEIAKDARSALKIIKTADVDLIVSDLRMPGLDGPGLYRALQRTRPALVGRLLFITGDVLAADIDRFLADTGAMVIEKPLDPEAFRRAVAARLDETQGEIA